MAGPFESTDDKGALERLEREVQGGRDGGDPDEIPTELELGADVNPPKDDDEPGLSRDEKKRARRPLMAELEAVREEAKRANDSAAAARAESAAILARFEQAQRGNAPDPVQKELDEVYADQERVVGDYNRRVAQYQSAQQEMPDEEARAWRKKAREVEERKAVVLIKRAGGGQQQDPQQITQHMLRGDYPDVYANPAALASAHGEFFKLRARGEPDSIATARKAMDTTRDEFGLSDKRRVNPDDARRYRGEPRGGTGGGSKQPARVQWNKTLQSMADSMYSHEPDSKKRAQMWVNANGKKYLEATRQRT
jgi:hypothetical protein